jgi:flavin reductase (DIM6/NTAB) family NADH-FMN oxidoreductase RutF
MHYNMSRATPRESYNLLIGLVAPRPIAFVTSHDKNGLLNAAPFSAYNYLGTDPPVVAIGIADRAGSPMGKDTARNIRETGEFVINVVNEDIAQAMNLCAIDFPPEVNELEISGLDTVASQVVNVPRIAQAPAALECREISTTAIGRTRIVLAQVLSIYVRDEFMNLEKGYVLAEELHSIGRMNGLGNYVKTRDAFLRIPRLSYSEWLEQNPEDDKA